MPDRMTAQQRHLTMSHMGSKDTGPELALRRALFRDGFRYRVNVKSLPGTPDIVLPRYRSAIFVNGCFWHGHKGCKLYSIPQTNSEFWKKKIYANRQRDKWAAMRLESLSWNVITVWECELKPGRLPETVAGLEAQLAENREAWNEYCARRRQNRRFAMAEARRKREIHDSMARELVEQFHITGGIVRTSKTEYHE